LKQPGSESVFLTTGDASMVGLAVNYWPDPCYRMTSQSGFINRKLAKQFKRLYLFRPHEINGAGCEWVKPDWFTFTHLGLIAQDGIELK